MPIELFARAEVFATAGGLLHFLGNRDGMLHILIIVVAAAVLWGGLMIVEGIRTRRSERSRSPWGLFLELCAAHQLDRTERHALRSAAQTLPEADCCRIFLDPQILDGLRASGSADAPEYARLATKLFGPGG